MPNFNFCFWYPDFANRPDAKENFLYLGDSVNPNAEF
jgi:hypothetical protein